MPSAGTTKRSKRRFGGRPEQPQSAYSCAATRNIQMESTMNRIIPPTLTAIMFLCLAVALPTGGAVAQQNQHVFYKTTAENSKYTQQNVIDVGDVPGHQVRIYEIHRTYPTNPPVINGLKLVEQWTRGTSDYIDNNGTSTTYGVYVL